MRRPALGESSDLSQKAHRQLIGYLGLLLPVILFGLAGSRPTTGLPRWDTLDSVSAYYYTGAVAAFVGVLFALALFLFTYRGYKNDRADRVAGSAGGLFALGVALFPTSPPGAVSAPSWWSPTTGTIHYVSAISLFIVFIVFSLWLFRKTNVPKGEPLPSDKLWRNRIYLICGLVMVVGVLWAGTSFFTGAPIFWPETIALSAFAASWLVKGYAYRPVVDVVRSALHR
ncbi:MAG: DUF998 domain-containing protein [Gemmatimonadota bacterium]|nr:MAG: DUF998 domain-containing protein [Gemmatimonadota bacterium]